MRIPAHTLIRRLERRATMPTLSSGDIRVESNGFGGYSSTYPGLTWSDFLDKPGVSSAPISYIFLDLDGYYTQAGETQQMLVSHLRL